MCIFGKWIKVNLDVIRLKYTFTSNTLNYIKEDFLKGRLCTRKYFIWFEFVES